MNTKIDYYEFEKIITNASFFKWASNYFSERLGLPVSVENISERLTMNFRQNELKYRISFTDYGRENLFKKSKKVFYLSCFDIYEYIGHQKKIPSSIVLYGIDKLSWFYKIENEDSILINYDFISYAFWTLNRIEEIGIVSKEKHGRFELFDSHLSIDNLYKRPIVDEWILLLKNLLEAKGFSCAINNFNFQVSHDVDIISRYRYVPFFRLIANILIDVFKRRHNLISFLKSSKKYFLQEPSNSFDWLMDISEYYGIRSKFYFLTNNTSIRYDFRYNINESEIIKIIKNIHARKHEIGIHYSYNASSKKSIQKEWDILNKICMQIGIPIRGGRMHYLRLKFLETYRQLEVVGQEYDSTLTFHECGGFRSGTCFPYRPFDIFRMKEMNILIVPLIIMEGSVIGYSKYGVTEDALIYIKELIDSCRSVNGSFSLLWHNSDLDTVEKREMYLKILEYCSRI